MAASNTRPGVLLCEGPNDQHVVWALAEIHQLAETFEVHIPKSVGRDGDGVAAVLSAIPGFRLRPGLTSLGILVDADEQPLQRWQILRRIFVDERGQSVLPEQPDPCGTITRWHEELRVGVWLMPDNRLRGKLEDFLLALCPEGERTQQLVPVDQFLGAVSPPCFAEKDRCKARIHAYLAVQPQPGKPLGQALTARYLDPKGPGADRFVQWLRRLFIAPS